MLVQICIFCESETQATMEDERTLRFKNLLRANASEKKTCCYQHLLSLLKASSGMPFASLTHVNFLQCLDCRHSQLKEKQNTDSSTISVSPSLSGDSSSSSTLLDAFFHEYSAEVASRASKRAPREYSVTNTSSKSVHDTESRENKEIDEGDCGDGDVLIRAPADTSSREPIPHHVLLGDGVLSRVPLCDILRARLVSRTWMNSINAFLRNPAPHVHGYLRHPCLMLLHPASTKTGTSASLDVFDFSLNSWLPKPIIFPSNASVLVGASLGLFCFATDNPEITDDVDFFVGNPLLGTWTHLPRVAKRSYDIRVIMAFVASEGNPGELVYKLLRLEYWEEESCCGIKFFICDSHTKKWQNMANHVSLYPRSLRIPNDIVFEASGLACCICICGDIFWSFNLHTNKSMWGGYVDGMLHYDYQLLNEGASAGLPSVLWCAGKIFCVHRTRRLVDEPAAVGLIPVVLHFLPVEILRLEGDGSVLGDDVPRHGRWWVPVSRVPPNLLKQAVEEGSDGTDFVIGSDHARRIFFILRGSSKMLVFDVLSSIWETLPGCPIGHSFYPYKLRAFFEPLL